MVAMKIDRQDIVLLPCSTYCSDRTEQLLHCIRPGQSSLERRTLITQYMQRVVSECFHDSPAAVHLVQFGSVPLMTFLPDGDIDLSIMSADSSLRETWAQRLFAWLEEEQTRAGASFKITNVQIINAEVKLLKCLVDNIVVDISYHQLGGITALRFLEEVDKLIPGHIFKRSIILVKAWCYYESRVLGAHHGLFSTYALEILVLYVFNMHHKIIKSPLEVLYLFLLECSRFDWDNYCLCLKGRIPLNSFPEYTIEPLSVSEPLLMPDVEAECLRRAKEHDIITDTLTPPPTPSALLSSGATNTTGQQPPGSEAATLPQPAAAAQPPSQPAATAPLRVPTFSVRSINIQDPLQPTNNVGRSVTKGNLYRVRRAFAFGAITLANILRKEDPTSACNAFDDFFRNVWNAQRPGRQRANTAGNPLRGPSPQFLLGNAQQQHQNAHQQQHNHRNEQQSHNESRNNRGQQAQANGTMLGRGSAGDLQLKVQVAAGGNGSHGTQQQGGNRNRQAGGHHNSLSMPSTPVGATVADNRNATAAGLFDESTVNPLPLFPAAFMTASQAAEQQHAFGSMMSGPLLEGTSLIAQQAMMVACQQLGLQPPGLQEALAQFTATQRLTATHATSNMMSHQMSDQQQRKQRPEQQPQQQQQHQAVQNQASKQDNAQLQGVPSSKPNQSVDKEPPITSVNDSTATQRNPTFEVHAANMSNAVSAMPHTVQQQQQQQQAASLAAASNILLQPFDALNGAFAVQNNMALQRLLLQQQAAVNGQMVGHRSSRHEQHVEAGKASDKDTSRPVSTVSEEAAGPATSYPGAAGRGVVAAVQPQSTAQQNDADAHKRRRSSSSSAISTALEHRSNVSAMHSAADISNSYQQQNQQQGNNRTRAGSANTSSVHQHAHIASASHPAAAIGYGRATGLLDTTSLIGMSPPPPYCAPNMPPPPPPALDHNIQHSPPSWMFHQKQQVAGKHPTSIPSWPPPSAGTGAGMQSTGGGRNQSGMAQSRHGPSSQSHNDSLVMQVDNTVQATMLAQQASRMQQQQQAAQQMSKPARPTIPDPNMPIIELARASTTDYASQQGSHQMRASSRTTTSTTHHHLSTDLDHAGSLELQWQPSDVWSDEMNIANVSGEQQPQQQQGSTDAGRHTNKPTVSPPQSTSVPQHAVPPPPSNTAIPTAAPAMPIASPASQPSAQPSMMGSMPAGSNAQQSNLFMNMNNMAHQYPMPNLFSFPTFAQHASMHQAMNSGNSNSSGVNAQPGQQQQYPMNTMPNMLIDPAAISMMMSMGMTGNGNNILGMSVPNQRNGVQNIFNAGGFNMGLPFFLAPAGNIQFPNMQAHQQGNMLGGSQSAGNGNTGPPAAPQTMEQGKALSSSTGRPSFQFPLPLPFPSSAPQQQRNSSSPLPANFMQRYNEQGDSYGLQNASSQQDANPPPPPPPLPGMPPFLMQIPMPAMFNPHPSSPADLRPGSAGSSNSSHAGAPSMGIMSQQSHKHSPQPQPQGSGPSVLEQQGSFRRGSDAHAAPSSKTSRGPYSVDRASGLPRSGPYAIQVTPQNAMSPRSTASNSLPQTAAPSNQPMQNATVGQTLQNNELPNQQQGVTLSSQESGAADVSEPVRGRAQARVPSEKLDRPASNSNTSSRSVSRTRAQPPSYSAALLQQQQQQLEQQAADPGAAAVPVIMLTPPAIAEGDDGDEAAQSAVSQQTIMPIPEFGTISKVDTSSGQRLSQAPSVAASDDSNTGIGRLPRRTGVNDTAPNQVHAGTGREGEVPGVVPVASQQLGSGTGSAGSSSRGSFGRTRITGGVQGQPEDAAIIMVRAALNGVAQRASERLLYSAGGAVVPRAGSGLLISRASQDSAGTAGSAAGGAAANSSAGAAEAAGQLPRTGSDRDIEARGRDRQQATQPTLAHVLAAGGRSWQAKTSANKAVSTGTRPEGRWSSRSGAAEDSESTPPVARLATSSSGIVETHDSPKPASPAPSPTQTEKAQQLQAAIPQDKLSSQSSGKVRVASSTSASGSSGNPAPTHPRQPLPQQCWQMQHMLKSLSTAANEGHTGAAGSARLWATNTGNQNRDGGEPASKQLTSNRSEPVPRVGSRSSGNMPTSGGLNKASSQSTGGAGAQLAGDDEHAAATGPGAGVHHHHANSEATSHPPASHTRTSHSGGGSVLPTRLSGGGSSTNSTTGASKRSAGGTSATSSVSAAPGKGASGAPKGVGKAGNSRESGHDHTSIRDKKGSDHYGSSRSGGGGGSREQHKEPKPATSQFQLAEEDFPGLTRNPPTK